MYLGDEKVIHTIMSIGPCVKQTVTVKTGVISNVTELQANNVVHSV